MAVMDNDTAAAVAAARAEIAAMRRELAVVRVAMQALARERLVPVDRPRVDHHAPRPDQ